MYVEDDSKADSAVREMVLKLFSDGLESKLLSVIESLLSASYLESMVSFNFFGLVASLTFFYMVLLIVIIRRLLWPSHIKCRLGEA